jgi:predicted nucleic acid-binding protein
LSAALVDDPDHDSCANWFEQTTGSLVVPDLVIPEVCYLLATGARTHVEVAFLRSLIGSRLTIEHVEEPDIERMTELVDTYSDLPLGAVDASVVAVAERLGSRSSVPRSGPVWGRSPSEAARRPIRWDGG